MEHEQEFISFNHALSLFLDEKFPFAFIEKRNQLDSNFCLYLSLDQSPKNLTSLNTSEKKYFGFISFEGEELFFEKFEEYRFQYEFNESLVASSMDYVQTYEDWDHYLEISKKSFQSEKQLKKIVLHRKVNLNFKDKLHIENVLKSLPSISHGQHFFIFKSKDEFFISYSPETLVNIADNKIKTISLAGTFPRSIDNEKDKELEELLLKDPKNITEQKIVTENIVKKLDHFCSNIEVGRPFILKQKHVQHIASLIQADIENRHIITLIRDLHPTPALNGEPKELAKKIIHSIENSPRYFYGGAFGTVYKSSIHLTVGIRSLLVQNNSNHMTLFGGCGILPESNSKAEWEETESKMNTFINHFFKNR